jgi:hypothetical protein
MEAQFARLVSVLVYQLYTSKSESISSNILYILHVVYDLVGKSVNAVFLCPKESFAKLHADVLVSQLIFGIFWKSHVGLVEKTAHSF